MSYVSDSFAGDIFALEEAIRFDFRNYDTTSLDLTLQQVTKAGDQAKVIIEYNWQGVNKSTGTIIDAQRGTTGYTVRQEGGGYRIIAMDDPIIFGVSRASDFSTGGLNPVSSDLSAQDTLASLTVYSSELHDGEGFDFQTRIVSSSNYDIYYDKTSGLLTGTSVGIQVLASSGSLSDFTTVPSSGYTSPLGFSSFGGGSIIAVKDDDGLYSIFKITTGTVVSGTTEFHFDYKHQTNGTTNVP